MYGLVAGVGPAGRAREALALLAAPFAALLGAGPAVHVLARRAGRDARWACWCWRRSCRARAARRRGACRRCPRCVLAVCAASFAWCGRGLPPAPGQRGHRAGWYLARYEPAETRAAPAAGRAAHDAGARRQHRAQGVAAGDGVPPVVSLVGPRPAAAGGRRAHAAAARRRARASSALLAASVRAPATAGPSTCWSGTWCTSTRPGSAARASRRAMVPVVVGEPPARPAPEPSGADVAPAVGWQPGRWELWRLALGMWRERPLTGVGPDNFRWLYGPRAGHAVWDTRVFANNLLPGGGRHHRHARARWRSRRRWPRARLAAARVGLADAAPGAGRGRALRAAGGGRGARHGRLPARLHRALPAARGRRGARPRLPREGARRDRRVRRHHASPASSPASATTRRACWRAWPTARAAASSTGWWCSRTARFEAQDAPRLHPRGRPLPVALGLDAVRAAGHPAAAASRPRALHELPGAGARATCPTWSASTT